MAFPVRCYIGVNLFLCTSATYMFRTCFILALRDMIQIPDNSSSTLKNSSTYHVAVTRYSEWSSDDDQLYLISAYYVGYVISNLFGGILAEQYGATRIITFILAISSISFAMIPIVVTLGYRSLFLLRLFQGSVEGPIYPSIHYIIAFWSPPCEKGRFVSAFAGSSFGAMIGYGIVVTTLNYFGWPFSFYFAAVIGATVWLIWVLNVTDRPDMHRTILEEEKAYIEKSIGKLVHRETRRIPHWTIIKSGPVGALVVLNFGASFTSYLSSNSIPTYYNEVLGYPVAETATILVISSFIRRITCPLQHKGSSFVYFLVSAHFIPGVILICMCYLTNHPMFSAALDILITALMGFLNLTDSSETLWNHLLLYILRQYFCQEPRFKSTYYVNVPYGAIPHMDHSPLGGGHSGQKRYRDLPIF